MKLYEVSENISRIQDMLENEELPFERVADTLELLEMEFSDKVENIVKFVRAMEGDIEAIKKEEERLSKKRKALENRISSLKEYMQYNFDLQRVKKVKTSLFTISLQRNAPSVQVVDEKKIPSVYFTEKVQVSLDKKAVLEKLKNGEQVDGVEMKQTESIRIR